MLQNTRSRGRGCIQIQLLPPYIYLKPPHISTPDHPPSPPPKPYTPSHISTPKPTNLHPLLVHSLVQNHLNSVMLVGFHYELLA